MGEIGPVGPVGAVGPVGPQGTAGEDSELALGASWDRWDTFDRPDGAFTHGIPLPSGQTWVVTGAASGSVLGAELKTAGKALVYETRDNASADPKAYMWTERTAPFSRFAAAFSFGAGSTTAATVGFIWGPKSTADTAGIPTSNGVNGAATNSIHGSIGPDSWSFFFFKAGAASPVFASAGLDGTWETPLAVDQQYTVSVERIAVDAMRLWLPAKRVGGAPRYLDITDALVLSRTGVADKIADLWPSAATTTALIEFLQPVATRATDRHARFHGYFVGGTGENYERLSAKNVAGGYAGLDAAAKVAPAQLPRLVVVKSAVESVLNSTAVQDDDELNVPIAADETWVIEWNLRVDGSTTGDVRFVVAAPVGAAGSVSILSQATSATSAFGAQLHQAVALGANVNAGTVGAGTPLPIVIRAVVRNGATAGSVRLQWAQVALDAVVPTRVLADSTLVAHRR